MRQLETPKSLEKYDIFWLNRDHSKSTDPREVRVYFRGDTPGTPIRYPGDTPDAPLRAQLRSAKPRERAYKLFDTGGLYVLVKPNGSKLWRMRFIVAGKEKVLALGAYPKVGLQKARQDRNAARERLDDDAIAAAVIIR